MEKILAKIACPELDTDLFCRPPSAETWIWALTDEWRPKFEEMYATYKIAHFHRYAAYFIHFGNLVHTLKDYGFLPVGYPTNFSSFNSSPLIRHGIMDELRLASIIGTTPKRAAELNGAVTKEEIEYYKAMKIDMPKPLEVTDIKFKTLNEISKMQKDPMVHHPKHYTKGDIECIDAMASVVTGLEGMEAVHTANVIKYMWRWKDKNGLQDLEKAKWYLDKLIEKVKKEK